MRNRQPSAKEHGWILLIRSLTSAFFILQPIFEHTGRKQWLLTVLGTIIFLATLPRAYFGDRGIRAKFGRPRAVGLWNSLHSTTAHAAFFIFAAALLPYIVDTELGVLGLIGVIAALVGLETWLLHLSGWFAFYGAGLSVVVGGTNIYFAQRNAPMYYKLRMANEEIEHLAKVAERERIARDLHDVLGHTFVGDHLEIGTRGKTDRSRSRSAPRRRSPM